MRWILEKYRKYSRYWCPHKQDTPTTLGTASDGPLCYVWFWWTGSNKHHVWKLMWLKQYRRIMVFDSRWNSLWGGQTWLVPVEGVSPQEFTLSFVSMVGKAAKGFPQTGWKKNNKKTHICLFMNSLFLNLHDLSFWNFAKGIHSILKRG